MKNPHGSLLIKNAFHNIFNTFITSVVTWVVSIWVARQLGPSNYGVFSLVLWVTGIANWFISMGLTHSVTKYIAEYSGKGEKEAFTPICVFVLKIEIVLSVLTTVILLFFRTSISTYFFSPNETFFFMLAFLGILPGIITAILSSAIEGIQKFKYFTYANLIISPFSVICKIFVIIMGWGISGLLITMLVFSIINSIFYFIILRKEKIYLFKNREKLSPTIKKRINKYNLSVIPIILCDKIIWDKSETFFLGRFCNATEIGFYNLGFNIITRITSILPSTFWRVLFPAMSFYSGSGEKMKTKRVFFLSTRYLAFISFPIGIGGAIIAYPFLYYLYGHEFVGAQRTLQILFLSSIFTSISPSGAAVLYGYEKQSFIYKLGFFIAIFNIILDIFLIRAYGATGAAVCYAVTTLIGSSIGTIYTCKKMKLIFPFVSISKIALSSIIMGTVMEIILLQNGELPGFIISIPAGIMVYFLSSLVLGTFEEEDYTLLRSVSGLIPKKAGSALNSFINFISEFKSDNRKDQD